MAIPGGRCDHRFAGAAAALQRVSTAHAGSVRGARRRDLLQGGWFPPGMAIPGGGVRTSSPLPALHASAVGDMHDAGPVRGARRRDLLSPRLVPTGHADPGRPRCDLAEIPVTSPKSPVATPEPIPAAAGAVGLRVLEWNVHHGVGTDGHYNLDRIATWIARINPHVVMLNEVEMNTSWGNEDQPARFEALLEAKTGRNWYRMFTQEFGDSSANGKGHLILSVYPIDAVSRIGITPSDGLKGAGAAGEASITVNGRNISLVISHLDPESQTMRLTQAKDVIGWAASYAENRIIAGDMNAWPDQSSIAEFAKTYNDSWAVAASHGTAQSVAGISPSGATRSGRIDYIFYSKNASQLVLKSSKVYDTRDASGYMPSDHRPIVSTFEVR